MKNRVYLILLTLSLSTLFIGPGGCSCFTPPEITPTCQSTTDCLSGENCLNGACVCNQNDYENYVTEYKNLPNDDDDDDNYLLPPPNAFCSNGQYCDNSTTCKPACAPACSNGNNCDVTLTNPICKCVNNTACSGDNPYCTDGNCEEKLSLNPNYRHVFVTSQKYSVGINSDFDSAEDADQICDNLGKKNYGKNWMAILATQTQSAEERVFSRLTLGENDNKDLYLLDGTKIGGPFKESLDGYMLDSSKLINIDETVQFDGVTGKTEYERRSVQVWTGSRDTARDINNQTCDNWSNPQGNVFIGNSSCSNTSCPEELSGTSQWFAWILSDKVCSQKNSFYCIEVDLP